MRKYLLPSILFIIIFYIYISTLASTISGNDSSELAAVQATLGIAHPTGYPLFTLIGYLFSLIPLGFSKIYQLNLLNALFSALAVIAFMKIIYLIISNISLFLSKTQNLKLNLIPDNYLLYFSALSSFILALSLTFWVTSSTIEVYSLQIMIVLLLIYILIKIYIIKQRGEEGTEKLWIIFSVLLALGFANHMNTIYALPLAFYLYFRKFNSVNENRLSLLRNFLIFVVLIVLLYSYLPVMASMNPDVNWGNPVLWENFINHITAKIYSRYIVGDLNELSANFNYLIVTLIKPDIWEFGILILFSLFGIVTVLIIQRKLLYGLMMVGIPAFIIPMFYKIIDVEVYFLTFYSILAVLIIMGIYNVFLLLNKKYFIFSLLVLVFSGTYLYAININKADQSENYVVYDYAKSLLSSVDSNSIILTDGYNRLHFPSFYLQYAENYRKDVAVISVNFFYDWYFPQLKMKFPDIIPEGNKQQLNINLKKRSVYLFHSVKDFFDFGKEMELAPDLLIFKVVEKGKYHQIKNYDPGIRLIHNVKYGDEAFIRNYVYAFLKERAKYELKFGYTEKAEMIESIIKEKYNLNR